MNALRTMNSTDLQRTIFEYAGGLEMPSFKISENQKLPINFLPSTKPHILGILTSTGASLRAVNKHWNQCVNQYVKEASLEMTELLKKTNDAWYTLFTQAFPSKLPEEKSIELMIRVMEQSTWKPQSVQTLQWKDLESTGSSQLIPVDHNSYYLLNDQIACIWLTFFPQTKFVVRKYLYEIENLQKFQNLANQSKQWFVLYCDHKQKRRTVEVVGPKHHTTYVRPKGPTELFQAAIYSVKWSLQNHMIDAEINFYKNKTIILEFTATICVAIVAIFVMKIINNVSS